MSNAITSAPMNLDAALQRALLCSRYMQRLLDSDSTLRPWLREQLAQPGSAAEIASWLAAMPVSDEASLSCALRQLRKRVMLKLILRDLNGLADLNEVTTTMSALAEVCLQQAQTFTMNTLVAQHGYPVGEMSGTPQTMLVIGMGKLGGRELNVSSDIDLIFIYGEDGNSNGARSISNHEFFSKLGRRLIALIGDLTEDGYVFRVDMRLRPYGDSGPLVMSLAALEEYLVEQGREWERYAWIKARVVSVGDDTALMQLTQPYIFRKYLDYGAFASMRKLHEQIRQEVQRRWLGGIGAFTLVLHTWTQDLRRHLHVHALMACGALQRAGDGDGV